MATVQVTKYSFSPPKEISEMDFRSYKQMIMTDYNSDICPKDTSVDRGISGRKIARWSLMAVATLIAPAVAIAEAESAISRSKSKRDMSNFYNDFLKPLLLNSKDYADFANRYKTYVMEKYYHQDILINEMMQKLRDSGKIK